MRAGWYALAAALMSAALLIFPGIGAATAAQAAGGGTTAAGPGSVLWTAASVGDGSAVAADPRGGKVFAAGSAGLVAYDVGNGAKLWSKRPGAVRSVAVSPDGQIVFVIRPVRTSGNWDYLTTAFAASDGRRLWIQRYNGRANGDDRPVALAVSPSGGTVFVTGTSQGQSSGRDFATVAYAAVTGRQLWVSRFNRHARSADLAAAIAVSPLDGTVFVTGTSSDRLTGYDFATVAYASATGAPKWTRRNARGNIGLGFSRYSSMAASPDGHRFFVTGASQGSADSFDFLTVAYAAGTGARLWVRRYHGPSGSEDIPVAVLASPVGSGTVVVAGGGTSQGGFAVAYSSVTGRQRWVSRFVINHQLTTLTAAAIGPDGRSFYVTGVVGSGAAFTVAAKVATGAPSWSQTVATTTQFPDLQGRSIAVGPASGTVYVGVDFNASSGPDAFTIVAYQA
jgi:WD40 repeat protein